MKKYIKGTFKKTIFSSSDGFYVGLFKVDETNDEKMNDYKNKQITFTGLFSSLNESDNYTFFGELIENQKYGKQYKVDSHERIMPEEKDSIIEFLSSSMFPGIGNKTAMSIVETLGKDCINMISDDYNCLLKVPKLSIKKAKSIRDALIKYNESYETILYMTNFGFNMKEALKIYNLYKGKTIEILNENPYDLVDNNYGIYFNKIDSMKAKLNIDDSDDRRVRALIIYIMISMVNKTGDTYLMQKNIYNVLNKNIRFFIEEDKFNDYIKYLENNKEIVVIKDKVFLIDLYEAEKHVADYITSLLNLKETNKVNAELQLEKAEHTFSIVYNNEQKEAILNALLKNISIITGGPGTGKTTIINAIIYLYQQICASSYSDIYKDLVLLAPTGRAAKRMSDICEYPASTIHRYLKWNKESNEFAYNQTNKVNAKFIIIDETSMIDINLLANLLRAVKPSIKIVFIGDYNQLESVGPGKVLKDMIQSELISYTSLTNIYRQEESSYIIDLAYEVNSNDLSSNCLTNKDDYTYIESTSANLLENIVKAFKDALKTSDIKDVQVLVPMYKGPNGIDSVNKRLQNIYNPSNKTTKQVIYEDVVFRENDKILQLENMPDDNVFNGDIGFIKKIEKDIIYIDFDSNLVKYTRKDYKSITHGYAISIHKAQGSEFDTIIMPIVNDYYIMLYKRIIYTGITRAKKKLVLLGSVEILKNAISRDTIRERKTYLNKLLDNNIF